MAREKMRREELYVTVPSLFRCPISMDVMKSPVSLCTGVTYDRSSIEKWLALGNKTCPATMQKLPSTHTTPNLTLRRLIQLWVEQAEISSQSSSSPSTSISRNQADDIINKNGDMDDAESLAKLIGFMKASEENLKFVASSENAVMKFVGVLANSVSDGEVDSVCAEAIVEVLDLITSENIVRERLRELMLTTNREDCLSSFVMILRKGDIKSKVRSARILERIATSNPESQRRIAEKEGLLHELYALCTADNDPSAVEAGLSALLTISTSRQTKKELVRFGTVKTATKILSGSKLHSSPVVVVVVERALAILESIATCTEGRNAICEDDDCVIEIVKRLMKCSPTATEHGITVLWSVCCLSRDGTSIQKVAGVNGLTKVLLVMQSDCSASTRQMCGDLVKVLKAKTARSSLATYETKTTHITPY